LFIKLFFTHIAKSWVYTLFVSIVFSFVKGFDFDVVVIEHETAIDTDIGVGRAIRICKTL